MPKSTAKDPGNVLQSFLDEYQLNPSKLGKDVVLSQSTIRQITLNKMKISVPIALRFAKYFGNSVEFWIDLQTKYSLAEAAEDKELDEVLQSIDKAVKPAQAKKSTEKSSPKIKTKKPAAVNKKEKTTKSSKPKAETEVKRPRSKKAK